MESLFLRGHASITEDALSAALADLLTDLDDPTLVSCILSRVRSVAPDGKLVAGTLAPHYSFDAFELHLWPSWPPWGEPDLLLTLSTHGSIGAALVIEAKYEAAKSGEDTEGDSTLKDQLGRYAAGLEEKFPKAVKRVVYLTGSSVPPTAELATSWASISKNTHLNPAKALGWISWRDVDRAVRDCSQALDKKSIGWRRTARVLALLERAGLRCFDGWPYEQGPPSIPPPPTTLPGWLKLPGNWQIDLAPDSTLGPPPSLPRPKGHMGWWTSST